MLSTAVMAGCNSARADDVVSVECKFTEGYSHATHTLPDADPETIARLTAVVVDGTTVRQVPIMAQGKNVVIGCPAGGHVLFVLR